MLILKTLQIPRLSVFIATLSLAATRLVFGC